MEISNQENSLITSFEDDNSTNTLNLKSIVDTFISKIRQKMSITETDLSFLVSNFGETVENILNYFNISDPEVDLVKSMFSKSKTFKAQKTIQSQNIRTVDPEEGMLGYRTETRLKNGRNILMNIKETFQYLPITKTLANIILNKHYFHLINNEKISSDQCPKIIKSFTDTETFRNHPFLKKFPKSIRISLYYDCVEMANIGGSKTGFNNIALFYFTIQNLSYPVNTELQNIFILLACYARDLKKYGFRKILEPLVEELKHLETEKGIEVSLLNETSYILRAVLLDFIGDGVAVHEILGLLSPSCKCFCRECLCQRNDLRRSIHRHELRSKELHERYLQQISEGQASPQDFGIQENSILNDLNFFNSTENFSYDVMHDIFEGVCPMDIKFVLRHFVIEVKILTVDSINERINNFRYGPLEAKNKPSPNFTYPMLYNTKSKNIRQRAVQCWVLLRVFPFLFNKYLTPPCQKYMELIILMIKIVEIVFSTEITQYMLSELERCIELHERTFCTLFPEVNLINKHHHLRHYVSFIIRRGPIVLYCCLRYEAKHFEIKKNNITERKLQKYSGFNYVNTILHSKRKHCSV